MTTSTARIISRTKGGVLSGPKLQAANRGVTPNTAHPKPINAKPPQSVPGRTAKAARWAAGIARTAAGFAARSAAANPVGLYVVTCAVAGAAGYAAGAALGRYLNPITPVYKAANKIRKAQPDSTHKGGPAPNKSTPKNVPTKASRIGTVRPPVVTPNPNSPKPGTERSPTPPAASPSPRIAKDTYERTVQTNVAENNALEGHRDVSEDAIKAQQKIDREKIIAAKRADSERLSKDVITAEMKFEAEMEQWKKDMAAYTAAGGYRTGKRPPSKPVRPA